MIDQQQYQQLIQEGYSPDEINKALKDYTSANPLKQGYDNAISSGANDPRAYAQTSQFNANPYDDMIKWQLKLDELLERIEHILRGDRLVFKQGNMIWQKNEDEATMILNEYGVQEVMRVLSAYLNTNTILSNYDNDVINEKVLDFGKEVRDLIYKKYEKMGLKKSNYGMIVRMLVDIVHSTYLRALEGGERTSLREARQVTEQVSQQSFGMPKKEAKIYNPFSWFSKPTY